MKESRIEEIVSLIAAGLFFSMWHSFVCNRGEIPMRQTCKVFQRTPEAGTELSIGCRHGNGSPAVGSVDH